MFVSIVLSSYNGEKFIQAQIASILAQSHSNFELIIIDDASSDATLALITAVAKTDSRITIISNTQNHGPRYCFFKGIQLATGDYIALADQDDIWIEDKLAILIQHASKDQDALLLYSNSRYMDESGQLLARHLHHDINPFSGADNRFVLIHNVAWGHSLFIKKVLKEYLLNWPPNFNHDKWICFVALSHGRIQYIEQPLQYYRWHTNNLTISSPANPLSSNPKIKEGTLTEWIEAILQHKLSKNNAFFVEMKRLSDGNHSWQYFFWLLKHRTVIFRPSKKSLLSQINHARRIAFNL